MGCHTRCAFYARSLIDGLELRVQRSIARCASHCLVCQMWLTKFAQEGLADAETP